MREFSRFEGIHGAVKAFFGCAARIFIKNISLKTNYLSIFIRFNIIPVGAFWHVDCINYLRLMSQNELIKKRSPVMSWNAPVYKYAWLEKENGMWHFVTDLYGDPKQSTRQWPDSRQALDELSSEGWTVVSPYYIRAEDHSYGQEIGYGLMWISDKPQVAEYARSWEQQAPNAN
jgi:hypothetical protein